MKVFRLLLPVAALCASCSTPGRIEVRVANDGPVNCVDRVVEVKAQGVLEALGSKYFYVTDADGAEVVSQLTSDSLILFPVSVVAGGNAVYNICPADTPHVYDAVAVGRVYPERADDLAWENDLVGFRAYGPATQAKGERAFGYDIFFKHPSAEPILEKLYGPECDPATWAKVDSLRKISPELAEDFIKSFSYHIDHGLGMDCYAVGPTLGAGVAALVSDTLAFPWCYNRAEVLDNGPLRFTAALDFEHPGAVVEHRVISLDAGSHLNRTKVWYDNLEGDHNIAVGFPLRDDSPAVKGNDYLAYADPTQGDDNGKAMLGVYATRDFERTDTVQNHLVGVMPLAANDTLDYYWGFAWDRADINDMEQWADYLRNFSANAVNPLGIVLKMP